MQNEWWSWIGAAIANFFAFLALYLQGKVRPRVDALEKKNNGPTRLTGADKEILESQARSVREIEGEWTVMYGKFDRTLKALQARDRRDNKREPDVPEDPGPGERSHADLRRRLKRR